MSDPQISIVVPLYNESEVFDVLIERIKSTIDSIEPSVEVILMDDGSTDDTPIKMSKLALEDDRFCSYFLSKNHGHQIALSAGLSVVRATEAIMIMDGDLQDPPELLPDFYAKFKEEYDVVYAIRKNRKESRLKKMAYYVFYRFLKRISYIDIPLDSGDFSMISRKVVDIINGMPERSRFVRGLRTWVGFKQTGLEYEREERFAGKPKYTYKALFNLAFDGIINFSEIPLKLMTRLGMFSLIVSSIYFGYTLFKKIFIGDVPTGFTMLLFAIIFFGGLQLISLGILGEYIIRIFFQAKGRPLFIIKSKIINKQVINE
ncbi:glycosyltransferase family 2 protein [Reichenbachiella sp.]